MKLPPQYSWLALALLFTGCATGYQLGNIPSGDMAGVKNIWVPLAKNDTFRPYVQPMLTTAVIHELDNDGTYQTSRAADAEATLNITVTKFTRSSVNQNPDNSTQTTQFRCTLYAQVTLTNNLTGKIIFKNIEFSGFTDYYVPNFQLGSDNVEAERQALPLATQRLAQNIVRQVTEGW
ncbi:MAG: LPS assembly lipoprotein LptE [Verrucomicrobiales bacterium]|jgi:hypothetical protein|nr:LPS assembly lipoprotein LptE [Verrucomicrobiales bacterium]